MTSPTNCDSSRRKTGERLGVLRVLAAAEEQARSDPLTGLPNRRTLEAQAQHLAKRGQTFVVAFADLDHFKALNDTFGHDAGDRALQVFARVLLDVLRPSDACACYGGEEFVVILPSCALAEATIVADRIRTKLADATKKGPPFTVSIGLAEANPGDTLSEVIEHADAALLDAKALGRDRVCTFEAFATSLRRGDRACGGDLA